MTNVSLKTIIKYIIKLFNKVFNKKEQIQEEGKVEGKMKVAVMNGIGKMGFEEREIPKPKADEVLVKLEYVGICGSDLHYY